MAGNLLDLPRRPVEEMAPAGFAVDAVRTVAQAAVLFQAQVEEFRKALHRRVEFLHDFAVVEVEARQLALGIVELLLIIVADTVFQGHLVVAHIAVKDGRRDGIAADIHEGDEHIRQKLQFQAREDLADVELLASRFVVDNDHVFAVALAQGVDAVDLACDDDIKAVL